ncbi:FecR domain-containing protein [Dyella sp. BiH032]|uniref:DUF6600 domain-containing protein n=1 Tax=Dyella sp. BiH032 TaxID=3075430 RepID=UPI002893553A|nr:DUF6600 domain-containing protein [Dyella sp. BiH032]WNL46950.1 FecR domain-containing protein [Dyella sp. BiH032]
MRLPQTFVTRAWPLFAAALLWGAAGLVQAQSQADGEAGDPPARVARLSYLSGDLGLLPAGAKDWSDASLNRPLTRGDRISTGADGRAELELDGGSLRMAQNTDAGFLDLNDQFAQVELTQGTLNLTVRNLDEGQSYEIDTPTVALVVDQPGTFRVDIDRDGRTTEVTAFRGRATLYGENNAQRTVNTGTRYVIGDSSLQQVTLEDIGDRGDSFDDWCYQRDQRYEQSPSRRYVSEDVVGYQDLDRYGDWQTDPDYGAVWYPSQVAGDWAPYRDGHWAWIAPWGWTWVDDAPWGFAPFHYGRWAYVGSRWGWIPGPVAVRPVYAPALVAFVGGGNWSVSIGIGGGAPVGWFPLGPREVYNPWYRASRNYYTNVNVTNIYVRNVNRTTVINNINNQYNYYRDGRPTPNVGYVNRGAPHAFSAVPGQSFASAQNVRRNLVRADARQFAAAPVLPRGVPIQPTRASFAPPRPANARPLPAAGFQREVVARRAPPLNAVQRPVADDVRPNRFGQRPGAPVATAPSNVRVLGNGAPGRPVPPQGPTREAAAGVPARLPPVDDANRPGNRPAPADQTPRRFQADDRPDFRQNARPDLRPNELPSARFAHPDAGDRAAFQDRRPPQGASRSDTPRNDTPRPGVSFVSNAAQDRERAAAAQPQAAPPPRSLPEVPRFNRRDEPGTAPAPEMRQPRFEQPMARPSERPQPAPENAAPREVERFREMRQPQPSFRPERNEPPQQPRIERAPPQAMPQPVQREVRPAFERPAPQPAPQSAPPPRPQNQPAQGQNRGGEHRQHGNRDERQN